MLARKCNRCGQCFDPFEQDGEMAEFYNPIFCTKEDIEGHKIGRKLMPDEQTNAYVDLCPECTEAFVYFMRSCNTSPSYFDDPDIQLYEAKCEARLSHIERDSFEKLWNEAKEKAEALEIECNSLRDENKKLRRDLTTLKWSTIGEEGEKDESEKEDHIDDVEALKAVVLNIMHRLLFGTDLDSGKS